MDQVTDHPSLTPTGISTINLLDKQMDQSPIQRMANGNIEDGEEIGKFDRRLWNEFSPSYSMA